MGKRVVSGFEHPTKLNILRGPARICSDLWDARVRILHVCPHRAQSLMGPFVYLSLEGDVPRIRTQDPSLCGCLLGTIWATLWGNV